MLGSMGHGMSPEEVRGFRRIGEGGLRDEAVMTMYI